MNTLINTFSNYKVLISAFSSGKDSSVTLAETFGALVEMKKLGMSVPKLLVTTSNTKIENPEVHTHVETEHKRIMAYAETKGLDVEVKLVQPKISQSFIGRVLTGQTLPVFANSKSRTCTLDYKIQPQQDFLQGWLKANYIAKKDSLTVVGTRVNESASRSANMKKVGTDQGEVSINDEGYPVFAPIAQWSELDVWEYIGEVRSGMRITYSPFDRLTTLYKDSNGECPIVQDNLSKDRKACGSRHGCVLCTALGTESAKEGKGIDKSLVNMINKVEEDGSQPYLYLEKLTKIQQFLINTQYDMNRRNWIGRKVIMHNNEAYVAIAPDTYNGKMVLEIYRYLLTAQFDEIEDARKLGIKARFSIITPSDIAYLDARWSERGLLPPFTAAKEYFEIAMEGKRYYPNENEHHERTAILKRKYMKLERYSFWKRFTNIYEGDMITTDDTEYMNINLTDGFDVHAESAQVAINLLHDDFASWHYETSYEAGFKFWFQSEVFTMSKRALRGVQNRLVLTNTLEDMAVLPSADEDEDKHTPTGQELYERAVELELHVEDEAEIETQSFNVNQMDLFAA